MPIPSTMADLSTTASLNSPAGSDNIASGDDYIRSIQAILKAQVSTGGAITAASTITPDASGQYYVVSGATGISAIGSTNSWNGRIVVLEFASTPVITHNGTSLILPGAANITAAAGDVAGFVQESSGNWRCIFYQRGASLTNGSAASGANSDITSLSALTSINGGPLAGLRNRIINGGMAVDQRNAGAAQTFTAAAALAYCVDRWYGYCTGANVTGQQVAGSAYARKRYQFTGAASVTGIGFGQRIEQANSYDLNNRTCTLAVDLANSLLTSVTWTAYYANSADTFGTLASPTRTQIATGTFTVNSTVTRYYANVAVPAAATTGIEIVFSVGAQTSGTWTIGDVSFVPGSASEVWQEQRPYGLELALCQRYLPVGISGLNDPVPARVAATNTNFTGTFSFKVPARVSPTGCTPNSVTDFTVNATTGGGQTSNVTFSTGGINGATVVFAAAAGTSGNGCEVVGRSASSLLYFTGCEL